MLETLLVEDFQTHSSLKVEFDPHVTTITGPTDSGKSSILRAIRWVCTNTPDGDGFIRDGQKNAAVTLDVDGVTIRRARGKGGNTYHVDDAEKRAFGRDVPDSVASVVQVDDVNFLDQHDSPFWLSLSSAEVSRRLNAIVDLDIIDRAAKNIAAKVTYAATAVKVQKKAVQVAREERDGLQWVVYADRDYKGVESLGDALADKEQTVSRLRKLTDDAFASKQTRDVLVQRGKALNGLGLRASKAMKAESKRFGLERMLENAKSAGQLATRPIPDLFDLSHYVERSQDVSLKRFELQELLNRMKRKSDVTAAAVQSLQTIENSIEEETGGRCPVCGKEMN